jgi:hypothetical protein
LEVAVDLLSRGFHVFRALSHSCSCDLAIVKDGKLIRVEVTTGHSNKNGTIGYPAKDETKFDILAVCTKNGIIYKPDIVTSCIISDRFFLERPSHSKT